MALFELEIHDTTDAASERRADLIEEMEAEDVLQLRQDIRRTYDLTNPMMNRAIGQCVANIIGIQTGKDFFNG